MHHVCKSVIELYRNKHCFSISLTKHWRDLLCSVAEVVQEGGDCTVPLAIIASFAALLLLLLLCICTALWFRQRRQASKHFSFYLNCSRWKKKITAPPPSLFPAQKVWLKYNEEDRWLQAVTSYCPVLAFIKGTRYFLWQRRNICCQQKKVFF